MANELSKFNLADSQSFVLIFPMLPPTTLSSATRETLRRNQPFELNIVNTSLPTLSFEVDDTSHIFKHKEIIGRITYETWNTTFLIDEKWEAYKILFKWIQYIDSNITDPSFIRHSKNEYKVDASLEIVNNYRNKILSFDFKNLSPVSLGEVTFNYQESTYLTCDVSFEYDIMKLEEE